MADLLGELRAARQEREQLVINRVNLAAKVLDGHQAFLMGSGLVGHDVHARSAGAQRGSNRSARNADAPPRRSRCSVYHPQRPRGFFPKRTEDSFMPDWFRRSRPPQSPADSRPAAAAAAAAIPAGAFAKCEKCGQILYVPEFERDLKVCAKCGHHHRLSAGERITFTADKDSFRERDADLVASDPLGFPEYGIKLGKGREISGRQDALVTGTARIGGFPVVLMVAEFAFMGGSMGSVFGEKFVRAAEHAAEKRLPTIMFCASGGARMQEGLFGLMQMAKTSAAVAQLGEARAPYIVVLTNPTTGGAFASFASLGDLIFAEPGAYVAFAGTRVAQQAQTHKPPAGYQSAEFQQERGMVDRVVPRKEMQSTLLRTLTFFGRGAPEASEADADQKGDAAAAAAPFGGGAVGASGGAAAAAAGSPSRNGRGHG
jgi:acetyl-CoA carboxylase carboxyl transferase subunit beta